MSENTSTTVPKIQHERLKFIDMARSIAIILMLEGHFITLTFRDYQPLTDTLRKTGNSGSTVFDWWVNLRGFTAPLFFTITGLVFVYLLTKHEEKDGKTPFFKIPRVKKGIRRVIMILFWAYILQINLKYLIYYLHGNMNSQLYAFHILQSIALGIACLILIYGFHKLIKKGPLSFYYLISGIIFFSLYPYFHTFSEGHYFPEKAPEVIQNIFHGPKSEFPIIPWMGFVLFGGMLGAITHQYEQYLRKKWFPYLTFLIGLFLFLFASVFGKGIDYLLAHFFEQSSNLMFEKNSWLYAKFAEVIMLLSFLMLIEQYIKIKESLFLKMGQNTLPIYIVHVIILYGAITGYSLKDLFKTELTASESIIGAVLFIVAFAFFIKYIEWFREKFGMTRSRIVGKTKALFKVFNKA